MQDVVFITGATSGFGEAFARRFAKDGARLVLTGRRTDRLEALARELDVEVHLAQLDVRDRAQVETVVATLPPAFADVTVLLNNAGLAPGIGPMQSVDVTQSETMIDTNIRARLSKAMNQPRSNCTSFRCVRSVHVAAKSRSSEPI